MCQNMTSGLQELPPAPKNSDAVAALIGVLTFLIIWLGATYVVTAGAIDLVSPTLLGTSLPSMDCLMQYATCLP